MQAVAQEASEPQDGSGWGTEPVLGSEFVDCPWTGEPRPWAECQQCRFFMQQNDIVRPVTERVMNPETNKMESVTSESRQIAFLCQYPTHRVVRTINRAVPPKDES